MGFLFGLVSCHFSRKECFSEFERFKKCADGQRSHYLLWSLHRKIESHQHLINVGAPVECREVLLTMVDKVPPFQVSGLCCHQGHFFSSNV